MSTDVRKPRFCAITLTVRRATLVFIGSSYLAALACSLVTDLDALKPSADGGADAGSDVKPPVDAATDAKDATANLDAATFCMGKDATFCADFDESPDLKTGWDNLVSAGGATLLESTTQFSSPPRAIHASLPTPVSDAGVLKVYANLGKSLPLNANTHVRIEADVRWDSATFGGNDYVQYFSWIAQATFQGQSLGVVGILHDSTHGWSMGIATMGPPSYFPMTTPPPENVWTHMIADVVLGTSGSLALSFDGKTALNPTNAPTSNMAPSYVGIAVGFSAPYGYSPAVGMTCDNVVVTLLP